jgi:sulfoxide reductase heme-binding subunit YedZ
MSFQPDDRQLAWLKSILFIICLLPLGRLLSVAESYDPGFDTLEFVQRWTGTWSFNLLLCTLCVSPLRALTQLHWLLRLRRMLGLFSFFYATLHFLSFIGLEHGFALDEIARDIFKRPFVTVGFAAFVLLVPLAATSGQRALRHLGGRKWRDLHRSIYLIGILACVHYLWLSKPAALLWPLAYAVALALLLGWRIRERRRKAMPVAKLQNARPIKFFKQRPD